MALPPATSLCWLKLANGGLKNIQTENLGTHMLAKRLDASHATPWEKAQEIYVYYTKWERGLQNEIAQFC